MDENCKALLEIVRAAMMCIYSHVHIEDHFAKLFEEATPEVREWVLRALVDDWGCYNTYIWCELVLCIVRTGTRPTPDMSTLLLCKFMDYSADDVGQLLGWDILRIGLLDMVDEPLSAHRSYANYAKAYERHAREVDDWDSDADAPIAEMAQL